MCLRHDSDCFSRRPAGHGRINARYIFSLYLIKNINITFADVALRYIFRYYNYVSGDDVTIILYLSIERLTVRSSRNEVYIALHVNHGLCDITRVFCATSNWPRIAVTWSAAF